MPWHHGVGTGARGKNHDAMELAPNCRSCQVPLTDIRGFTEMTSTYGPLRTRAMLDEYFRSQ